ncbi:ParB N-terminal domain-containing protein [Lacipirellula limnantheis]|uniref:ParB-like N-terminal domain-containing protein n=1 Tax=Lacipirellula limnantheis TaxID=2528024 RepID=A0A517U602_9BACT|nr:ParB N-terminal domain-containing protein [Lacipirellula limnantheis]QDT76033.1 hypothetical protein I41_52780 [Lacipirellula limnantheis]
MPIRDRIRELRRAPAGELRPNPRNWRTHPPEQCAAMRGLLAEIGYAGALLARELEDGSLELIDGHLRAETTPDAMVPVLVLDVTAAEADKILLTHDSVAALAEPDQEQLAALLKDAEFISPGVEELLQGLACLATDAAEDAGVEYEEVVIPESWQVVVECRDEANQREVFERMRGEGYRCRVLTLS